MLARWPMLACALISTAPVALAGQGWRSFAWTFDWFTHSGTTVAQCERLSVLVGPAGNRTVGARPWTMLGFEPGKVPSVQNIGDDTGRLFWTVRHAPGAKLLLTAVDNDMNYGGFEFDVYTVTEGNYTSCMPDEPEPSLKITSNVTDSLDTCAPWGLTVSGGTPPYSISFAVLGSDVITNVTGTEKDTQFTYINRVSPNTPILAAVSDATGQWGISTPLLTTTGSTDLTCAGLLSTWDSSGPDPAASTAAITTGAPPPTGSALPTITTTRPIFTSAFPSKSSAASAPTGTTSAARRTFGSGLVYVTLCVAGLGLVGLGCAL